MIGIVEDILIAESAGADLFSIKKAQLIAGKGIVGDRYYKSAGTFSKRLVESGDFEVTLIECEAIDAFNSVTDSSFLSKEFRRNIVTRGLKLNDLVGQEFYIGSVKLFATKLCEPCHYLANLLKPEVLKLMAESAGIRAKIICGGSIYIGSEVAIAD